MQRYKASLQYVGSAFRGAQKNSHGPTVQGSLETILVDLFGQDNVSPVSLSSRTDAGVHAIHNVCHFDVQRIDRRTGRPHGTPYDARSIQKMITSFHKKYPALVITDVETVSQDFHSRFEAQSRTYLYRILMPPTPTFHQQYAKFCTPFLFERQYAWCVPVVLDVEAMRKAASYLAGIHDFSSFRGSRCQASTPVRDILHIDVHESPSNFYGAFSSLSHGMPENSSPERTSWASENEPRAVNIVVQGRSFLYHMVRNIVGTLYDVGRGHIPPEAMQTILDSRDRRKAGVMAPAEGLYLVKVAYSDDELRQAR